jgi:hypothetical protein
MTTNSIATWAGQVTTGHGAMVLVGTLLACLHGDMTWAAATPLLAGSVVGLLWPENTTLAAAAQKWGADAQPLATDVETELRRLLARAAKPPVSPPASSGTAGTLPVWLALWLAMFAVLVLIVLMSHGHSIAPLTPRSVWFGTALLAVVLAGTVRRRSRFWLWFIP